jgi:hypothetical protein
MLLNPTNQALLEALLPRTPLFHLITPQQFSENKVLPSIVVNAQLAW